MTALEEHLPTAHRHRSVADEDGREAAHGQAKRIAGGVVETPSTEAGFAPAREGVDSPPHGRPAPLSATALARARLACGLPAVVRDRLRFHQLPFPLQPRRDAHRGGAAVGEPPGAVEPGGGGAGDRPRLGARCRLAGGDRTRTCSAAPSTCGTRSTRCSPGCSRSITSPGRCWWSCWCGASATTGGAGRCRRRSPPARSSSAGCSPRRRRTSTSPSSIRSSAGRSRPPALHLAIVLGALAGVAYGVTHFALLRSAARRSHAATGATPGRRERPSPRPR